MRRLYPQAVPEAVNEGPHQAGTNIKPAVPCLHNGQNPELANSADPIDSCAQNIHSLWLATSNDPNRVAAPNGGSARGYQEPFASFGCMAVLVTARRSVGQAVCLCIAALAVNVRNCRT